jgi:hypothetical protein
MTRRSLVTLAVVLSAFSRATGAWAQASPSYRAPGAPPNYPPSAYPPGYPPSGYPPPGYGPGYPPPGYPPGYPPPGNGPWHYAPPPAPEKPHVDSTVRMHDSFYMRMTVGAGYLGANQRFEPAPVPIATQAGSTTLVLQPSALSVGGFTTSFDFMFGGTPVPGFVVGGTFIFNAVSNPTVTLGDTSVSSDNSLVFWMPAMFIDVFPNPAQGFHAGGIVGVSVVDWERSGTGSDASGVGGGAFVGYDAWVGNQWSLGGLVRALGATASDTDSRGRAKFTVGSIALLVSALYH